MSKIDPREVKLPLTVNRIETGWLVVDSKGKSWAFYDRWCIASKLLAPIEELADGTWQEGEEE